MKLVLETSGTTELELHGDATIELPWYMSALSDDELKVVDASHDETVIAAGYDPDRREVTVLTSGLTILTVKVDEHGLPESVCRPTNFGHAVRFECDIEVTTSWLLSNAKTVVNIGSWLKN